MEISAGKEWAIYKKIKFLWQKWIPDEPKWIPDEPKWIPDKPKWIPDEPKWTPDEPKWTPDEPKWIPHKLLPLLEATVSHFDGFYFWNQVYF